MTGMTVRIAWKAFLTAYQRSQSFDIPFGLDEGNNAGWCWDDHHATTLQHLAEFLQCTQFGTSKGLTQLNTCQWRCPLY